MEPVHRTDGIPEAAAWLLAHFLAGTRRACGVGEEILMKIRPLRDRIVAKRLAEESKTSGGLFIPDSAKEKPLEARVIAVGDGKVLENGKVQALLVHAGDRILIGKYSGSEVKLDGDDIIILREDDVLALLDN
jgi:chaperonin GroES